MFNRFLQFLTNNKKKIILYLITVAISAGLLVAGNKIAYDKTMMFQGGYEDGASRASVVEIVRIDRDDNIIDGVNIGQDVTVVFKALMKSGEYKGQTVTACESIAATDADALKEVEIGDRVLLTAIPEEAVSETGYEWHLHAFDRTLPLAILLALFLLLIFIFGRKKGINTAISLSFTVAAVFLVFVPSVLSGGNIYLWSVLTCIYIIAMSLLINEGYSRKTLAAVIGCVSGVVVAGVLAVIMSKFLNLNGITGSDMLELKWNFEDINLQGIIFAGIILGAVGAVKDVAVSISSSLKELHEQVENPTFGRLVKSGMNIGRDIMGTMADTLVLAYIGCELSTTLLQVVYSSSVATLFSLEKIVVDVLQALVGSIGILLTIPLTAVVSAALYVGVPKFRGNINTRKQDKYYVEPADEPSLYESMKRRAGKK